MDDRPLGEEQPASLGDLPPGKVALRLVQVTRPTTVIAEITGWQHPDGTVYPLHGPMPAGVLYRAVYRALDERDG